MPLSRPVCVVALAVLSATALAQAAPPAPRDPKVQAVIDQMLKSYKEIQSLHGKLVVKMGSTPAQPSIPNTETTVELKLQRPNRFLIEIAEVADGKTRKQIISSDGKQMFRYMSSDNKYRKSKAPETLAKAGILESSAPEFEILFREKDPFADISPMTLAAPAKLADVDVNVLEAKMSEPGVAASGSLKVLLGVKDGLIRSFVFEGSSKDPATNMDVKFKAEGAYSMLNTAPMFKDSDFAFVPPSGASAYVAPSAAPKPAEKSKPSDKKVEKKKGKKP